MSGSFTGFSEDDIKRLKNGENSAVVNGVKNREFVKAKRNERKPPIIKNHTNRKPKQNVGNETSNIPEVFTEITDDAKLSTKNKSVVLVVTQTNDTKMVSVDSAQIITTTNGAASEVDVEKRFIDLEEFQVRQKLIEEQNRKRKELLSKALADRTKQTQEEAQRLDEIRNEFKKLDAILSNDVSILRQQIEVASVEYMEVQKRYNKIEREFLDVKLALHQKLERKEMLTEHLCTIIEKNEERKAEKLSELISRLDLDAGDCNASDNQINNASQMMLNQEL